MVEGGPTFGMESIIFTSLCDRQAKDTLDFHQKQFDGTEFRCCRLQMNLVRKAARCNLTRIYIVVQTSIRLLYLNIFRFLKVLLMYSK
jgi:hypothetical protein